MNLDVLKQELSNLLDEIDDLEHKAEVLQQTIEVFERGYVPRRALPDYPPVREQAVAGLESPPREVPTSDASPRRPPVEVDTRPFCGGCGGRMEPAIRTLNSGKVVSYLMCTDSGCNNEQF